MWCKNATYVDRLGVIFKEVKRGFRDFDAKMESVMNGKLGAIYQTLGVPPNYRELPRALANAFNFTTQK